MAKGIFILGTDTGVGKTFATAGIAYILKQHHHNVCCFKAVQSGGILKDGKLVSGDIKFIKDINDMQEFCAHMNSYCLKAEVSPHMAAEAEGINININKILEDYKTLGDKYDYVVVEGAGGIIVPIIREKYYIYNLVKDLDIPAVVVARAGVGTINHTALTVNFAKSIGITIKGIIINGYNGSYFEKDNIKVIENITGIKVISVLSRIDIENEEKFIEKAKLEYARSMNIDEILKVF
ncbi:dethiobiotin synthetase [Anaerobacterium chartisolvens]|uniref:ATP-dependent dethiobiotin synthetase BioD n=1 Tax=Anaerobacterium chartisolvens TaxID=1297424 RepID=A0A369BA18_9FIRM|nr:dethiobiotin synthase [Anaerobacterium chartisolvens]RCX18379.1 dethiobiotin synthetase [Anaerobacterium chartisolvens]